MIKVFQTEFVATHGKGNCVQAAIASILDLSLDDVPAFRDLPADQFESAIDRFLQSRGLFRISVSFSGAHDWGDTFINHGVWHPVGQCMVADGVALIFGKSPRSDCGHAIVGRLHGANVEVVHDPHPEGTGISGPPRSVHFLVRSVGEPEGA